MPASTPSTDETTFSIGDLAQELGVTTRTIRFYEERGLLQPARSSGRQRMYTRRDRGHLKLILQHREAGFTLEEMKELLELYDDQPGPEGTRRQMERFRDITANRLAVVDERLATLRALRRRLNERLAYAERSLKLSEASGAR